MLSVVGKSYGFLFRLIAPLILWIFVFRDFLFFHTNTINLDTILSYAVVKFFINNILNGVFPLWDPFVDLGVPFYSLPILGLFNPLIYLIAFLVKASWNYYDAYLAYIVGNFFLGSIGFYFLAKSFIKDERVAYLAYILLLFSGQGTIMFTQLNMLLIFVASVWFFCFLIRFVQNLRVGDFLGLTFSSMLVVTSYMPFHFLTVFGVFVLICLCIYRKEIKPFSYRLRDFFKKKFFIVAVCVLAVGVSLLPFILYKLAGQEIVTPARHCADKSMEACYLDTMNNHLGLSYEEITKFGTLGERLSLRNLFTHLDKVSFGAEVFFYLPVVCYLFLFISGITRLDRRVVVLTLAGTVIFLISLGDATGIYPFLFKHIVFFQYFRNLFFFMIFLLPIVILLAAVQFKLFLDVPRESSADLRKVFFVISFAHFSFFVFLLQLKEVLSISLAVIFLSWAFFILYCRVPDRRFTSGWLVVLIVISLLEPLQVFAFYNKNAKVFVCDLPKEHVNPVFSFIRPESNPEINCTAKNFLTYIPEFWHDMLLIDNPGTIEFPGTVARGVFFLSKHMDSSTWKRFVQNKFLLYDHIRFFKTEEQEENLPPIIDAIEKNSNTVFISNPDPELVETFTPVGSLEPHPQIISQENENFKILHFDVNSLKIETSFNANKFLVYTESFNRGWKVFINGKLSKLYKADEAFKGVWLPPGHNVVYFQYADEWIYKGVSLFFLFFLGGTLVYLFVENNARNNYST